MSERPDDHSDATPDYVFIDNSHAGSKVRLVLEGELDVVTAGALRDQLVDLVRRGLDIELDMAALSFMDSSGVGAVVHARSHLSVGQRLEIVVASAQVTRVLDVTGLRSTLGPADPSGSSSTPSAEYVAAVDALRDAEDENARAVAEGNRPPSGEGTLRNLRIGSTQLSIKNRPKRSRHTSTAEDATGRLLVTACGISDLWELHRRSHLQPGCRVASGWSRGR